VDLPDERAGAAAPAGPSPAAQTATAGD
jgi:hypothetical protein